MKENIFERCLIWVICQKAAEFEPPKTETELSIMGFSDVGNPVNAWRSVRNGDGKGKFRSLSVSEANNLACAVGTTIDKLCWDAANEIRHGWTMDQDVSTKKNNPGRRAKHKTSNLSQTSPTEEKRAAGNG